MNYIKSYLIVKSEAVDSENLNNAHYAWLPIEGTTFLIIFNITHWYWQEMLKRREVPSNSFFSNSDSPQPDMPISVEAFRMACNSFNQRIEHARATCAKYDGNFERALQKSMTDMKTGYFLWLNRCLIYGGLFNK